MLLISLQLGYCELLLLGKVEGADRGLCVNRVSRSSQRPLSFENRLLRYFCHFLLYVFDLKKFELIFLCT